MTSPRPEDEEYDEPLDTFNEDMVAKKNTKSRIVKKKRSNSMNG